MDFYMYLPSNTGDYIDNTISRFRVKLPDKIDLDGEWEVALVEIAYPVTWFNIGSPAEAQISVTFGASNETINSLIPFKNYTTIDGLCDAINYTMDHLRSSNGRKPNVQFRYDSIRHRIVIESRPRDAEPNISLINISPHIQYMLGLKSQELNLSHASVSILFGSDEQPKTVIIPSKDIVWVPKSRTDDIKAFDTINSIISDLVDSKGEHPNSRLGFAPENGLVVLHTTEDESNVKYIKFSDKLRRRLALPNSEIYPGKKYFINKMMETKLASELLLADDSPDISGGNYSLFVYCDVVRPQIVGNVLTPLLRVVSLQGSHGDIVNQMYDNPHYVPVLRKEFSTIEININDDRGRFVAFKYGKLFVKLHFRMKV